MAVDIMSQLKGLADDPQVVEQLKGLLPEGTDISGLLEDPSRLLDMLKDSPDLLKKIQELIPDVDIEGALASLTGAAGAADGAAGAASDAVGDATGTGRGIVDSIKGLFGKR